MECLAASLAANNATPDQLEKLGAIIQRQETLLSSKDTSEYWEELAQLDADFHTEISSISGNLLAEEILNALILAFTEDNKAIFFVDEGLKLVDEHYAIIRALQEHDPVLAEKSMHQHIGRVIDEVKSFQSSIGESMGIDPDEQ
jgi:GntR family transcriptional repressor for pyruvate dehydrogenase complex